MQDIISTLPTTNDQVNIKDLDTIKTLFNIQETQNAILSIQMFIYITILYFIVSSPQIENILTRYVECTSNSVMVLNVVRSIIFFVLLYLLFTYLIK
jgi:uncharacterized membrane protein